MKIGILTFHRAHNYGAVLQCFALQETLKARGYDVKVIDYRQPWIEEFYKPLSLSMIKRNASSLGNLLFYLKGNLKKFLLSPGRGRFFREFRDKYLILTAPCGKDIPKDFDFYLIGSDQLWSLHCLGGSSDPVFMGDFERKDGSSVVGYAISADIRSLESCADEICRRIDGFKAVSMREEKVAAMLSSLTGRECPVCVDPTLLAGRQIWEPVIRDRWKDRTYVLVYEVRWKKETRGVLKGMAQDLASRIGGGCEVIDASGMRFPVEDFVSLFRYARYVVTTSFHGVVFSILFHTPFYALPLWDGYDLRYRELLASLSLSDRLVPLYSELSDEVMDFSEVDSRLEQLGKGSLDFIFDSIER